MKATNMFKFIKLPEGVDFDLSQLDLSGLEGEWNRQLNGMKVAHGEETEQKVLKSLFEEMGVSDKEGLLGIKTKLENATKTETEAFQQLKDEIEGLKTINAEKEAQILKTNQLQSLKSIVDGDKTYKIKDDRLDKAYTLISSMVTEEKDFDANALDFVKSTPEWLENAKSPKITLGKVDNKDTIDTNKDKGVADYW